MIDPEFGGPDAQRRDAVYRAARLLPRTVDQIESMVARSGLRAVGKGALGNVVTRFDSAKNGRPRILESHTCELVYAYELELDTDVVGYYVQVPCERIERIKPGGRRHISSANIDYLVFRSASVELVECKQHGWLQRKALERDAEWVFTNGAWTCLPYKAWAADWKIPFRVWEGPLHPAVYLANLSAIYDAVRADYSAAELRICDRASTMLAHGPLCIAELQCQIPDFTVSLALRLMAGRRAFGPIKSIPISNTDRFVLFGTSYQADTYDHQCSQEANKAFQPLELLPGSLLNASATDVGKAYMRLRELQDVLNGIRKPTRRLKRLAKAVALAEGQGKSAVEACLTNYSRSGNRTPRLGEDYVKLRELVIAKYWNNGKARTFGDLQHVYASLCEKHDLPVLGREALRQEVHRQDQSKRALSTGGMRAYQSMRRNTDPRFTSGFPLRYGALAFIDSTPIDMRFVEPNSDKPMLLRAVFYIALDGATGYPLSYSFIFGPSRTEGLAVLMRRIVRKNGFLPHTLHLDRGPENTSRWFQSFCEGRISLRYSPTAGSAWNQLAESALKFANTQVAHRLFGSTLPDRKNRAIDGKFKSRRTARMQFSELHGLLSTYIDETLAHTPGIDGASPVERRHDLTTRLGFGGATCRYDDDFILSTSLPVKRAIKPTDRGSLRLEEGTYTSTELQSCLKACLPLEELRTDCESSSVVYCRFRSGWVKAFHRRIQHSANSSTSDALFDLCYSSTSGKLARCERSSLKRDCQERIAQATKTNLHQHDHSSSEILTEMRVPTKAPRPRAGQTLYPEEAG